VGVFSLALFSKKQTTQTKPNEPTQNFKNPFLLFGKQAKREKPGLVL
jgi:hypothetical protein